MPFERYVIIATWARDPHVIRATRALKERPSQHGRKQPFARLPSAQQMANWLWNKLFCGLLFKLYGNGKVIIYHEFRALLSIRRLPSLEKKYHYKSTHSHGRPYVFMPATILDCYFCSIMWVFSNWFRNRLNWDAVPTIISAPSLTPEKRSPEEMQTPSAGGTVIGQDTSVDGT